MGHKHISCLLELEICRSEVPLLAELFPFAESLLFEQAEMQTTSVDSLTIFLRRNDRLFPTKGRVQSTVVNLSPP